MLLMALAGVEMHRDSLQARSRGLPVAAILGSTAFGYVTVAMSYLSPTGSSRFSSIPTVPWRSSSTFLIAGGRAQTTARLESEMPERLRMRMWDTVAQRVCDRGDARDRGGDVRHPRAARFPAIRLVSVAVLLQCLRAARPGARASANRANERDRQFPACPTLRRCGPR